MDAELLNSLVEKIKIQNQSGIELDEELIYDCLYNCGTWLNERQISAYAKELRKIFGIIRAKDLE